MLGWKYDGAEEESQRYKVGKYILETKMVFSSSDWEHDDLELPPGPSHMPLPSDMGRATGDERSRRKDHHQAATTGAAGAVEFDSQDEDECEDLFAGVWSPGLALKRRQNKSFRKAVVAELDARQQ